MRSWKSAVITAAPAVVAFSLIFGNAGLLLRRGLHPNLETAAGLVWILSDYALRQRLRYPVAAPRANAAGVILGSLLLAAGGIHADAVDWHRVRTPLGYIPSACIVGLQHELRRAGDRLLQTQGCLSRGLGHVLHHPFAIAAAANAYGVVELARSAAIAKDAGLLVIAAAYGAATLALPLLDYRQDGRLSA